MQSLTRIHGINPWKFQTPNLLHNELYVSGLIEALTPGAEALALGMFFAEIGKFGVPDFRKSEKPDFIKLIVPLFSTQIFLLFAVTLLLCFEIENIRTYLSGKTLTVFLKMYLHFFQSLVLISEICSINYWK